MLRLFFFFALPICTISCNGTNVATPPEIDLDPVVIEEFDRLRTDYYDFTMAALDPIPPDAGISREMLAKQLTGAYAQGVVALCSSTKVIAFQAELLNTLVEPNLNPMTALTDLQCERALRILSIQLGPQGGPFERLADQY